MFAGPGALIGSSGLTLSAPAEVPVDGGLGPDGMELTGRPSTSVATWVSAAP